MLFYLVIYEFYHTIKNNASQFLFYSYVVKTFIQSQVSIFGIISYIDFFFDKPIRLCQTSMWILFFITRF